MSPILGGIGGVSVRGFGHFPNLYFSSFDSIATQTVGAGGSTGITFSSIPSGYTHLQIRGLARTARASYANDGLKLQFNADTGNNYSRHQLSGDSSGGIDTGSAASSDFMFTQVAGDNAMANNFGTFVIDILDYTNTNKYKTVKMISGVDNNSSASGSVGYVSLSSGAWLNTNVVSSIKLFGYSGNLLQNSTFGLYGIKVA